MKPYLKTSVKANMKDLLITEIDKEMAKLEAEKKLSTSLDEKVLLSGKLLGLLRAKQIVIMAQ